MSGSQANTMSRSGEIAGVGMVGVGGRGLRRVMAVLVAAVLASLCGAASALAVGPALRVDSVANTTAVPGGTLDYHLQLSNVGGEDVNGNAGVEDPVGSGRFGEPIRLTAMLGLGLTFVSESAPEGSPNSAWSCSGTTVVTCEDTSDAITPNEFSAPVITVAVEGGASGVLTHSSFTVEGGNLEGAVGTIDPTRITSEPPVFGVDAFDVLAADAAGNPFTQAGGHPDSLSTSIDMNTKTSPDPRFGELTPVKTVKDIVVDLPPGLVGNPSAAAKCTSADLANASLIQSLPLCSPASQVGTTFVRFNNFGQRNVFGPIPVFNLVAPPGVPARLGFSVLGTPVTLDARVRSGGDYGVSVDAGNIPAALALAGTTLTLWGTPADASHDRERACPGERSPWEGGPSCAAGVASQAFLRNPTACTQPGEGLPWSMHVDSWSNPGAFDAGGEPQSGDASWRSASFTSHNTPAYPAPPGEWGSPQGPTGCAGEPFTPSFTVQPMSHAAESPSGLDVRLTVTQEALTVPGAVSQADLRKLVVTLPESITINPSVATGLGACTPAQIGLHSAGPAACPDASKIGTAEVQSPVLDTPLEGGVYLASQGDNPFGSLAALYLVAEGSGVVVKLAGKVELDPVTGRVTTTFDNLPQQPVASVKLSLFNSARAALTTSAACGSSSTESTLEGWNGHTATVASPYDVECASGLGGFNPGFRAGTVNPQAGAFSPFTVMLSRNDGEQQFGGLTVKTPPGLLGILKGVAQCPEPQASQGSCGEDSLVGHVRASVGTGPEPFETQEGKAYLTGPYKGGPFGLSVAIPAKAGPFDLGTVVVRSRIDVDPHTTRVTITSDPFPQILQGIPLRIRTVNVTVDRPGFIFNPTNCEPLSVDGAISSTQGATASVSSHFQAANCAVLPFHPSFKVSTKGATSKKGGAFLDVKIASSAGQANLGKVAVTLPKQLPSWLPTIQQACLAAVFDQNPAGCPARSDIGTATATTPILSNPVTGPVYLVSHGGAAFPDIVMVLQGEGVTVEQVGSINIKGQVTSSAFNSIPDVPITTFELNLPQGPHHALSSNLPAKAKGSFCGQSLVMPTTLTGQNGAQIKQSTKIAVTGCPKAKKKAKRKAKKHAAKGKKKGQ